ncbi:MAG: hypothetical protein IJ214_07145 [Clostridia bacterium]|nr:hypothetical protein [Clostridia bacterium]
MSLQETKNEQLQIRVDPQQNGNETEIDLIELLYRLLENAKYIIPAAIIGAIIAGVYTFMFVTPKYTATSKLYVVNTGSAVVDLSSLQIGTQLASDYKEVFSNWHVHERVLEKLDLPYTYRQLNSMVSVTNSEAQRILHIRVVSTSPDEAKLLADTYAEVAQEFIAEVMSTQRPNIFEEALRPSVPSSPNKTRNIMLGFLLGGFLAAGIVVIQFIADDRLHSEEDFSKYLGLPVLGIMPSQQDENRSHQNESKRGKRKS